MVCAFADDRLSPIVLGLTLVSAPHLARSYHHLFPLKCFSEVSLTERYQIISLQAPDGEPKSPQYTPFIVTTTLHVSVVMFMLVVLVTSSTSNVTIYSDTLVVTADTPQSPGLISYNTITAA